MTWNYRVVRHIERDRNNNETELLSIHEVYYDDGGRPENVTENAVPLGGETVQELREVSMMQRRAMELPVLDWDTFGAHGYDRRAAMGATPKEEG